MGSQQQSTNSQTLRPADYNRRWRNTEEAVTNLHVGEEDLFDLLTHARGWIDYGGISGNIRAVLYPNGIKRTFEFNEKGELTRFSTHNFHWKRVDETWSQFDKSGQKLGESLPTGCGFNVDEKGNFIFVDEDGTQSLEAPDGSALVRTIDGRILSVTQPDGNHRSFEYDSGGALIRFSTRNGSYWHKANSIWNRYHADDSVAGGSLGEGSDCEVDSIGNFIFIDKGGAQTIEAPNGSVLIKDASGKVTSVTHPDGEVKMFEYTPDGTLFKVDTSRESFSRKTGDSWIHYDRTGRPTGFIEPSGTEMHVDNCGNFIVRRPNGRIEVTAADGAFTVKVEAGDTQV
ncbi:MAG TPA: hypothetical protein V6C97_10090 [Oculatellaceae cyanobacterium]